MLYKYYLHFYTDLWEPSLWQYALFALCYNSAPAHVQEVSSGVW